MENSTIDSAIKKNALNNGLILGAVVSVLGIFSFYFITSLTTSFWAMVSVPFIFSIIIPVVLAILMTIDIRKKIGGFWTFKQATTGAFILFLVCYIVSGLVSGVIFGKLIEPEVAQKTETAMVNATTAMMEKQGVDQAKIDKQTADVEKRFEDQKNPTVGKTIQGIAINLILLFVVAVIFGAIFKKDPPFVHLIDPETDPTV